MTALKYAAFIVLFNLVAPFVIGAFVLATFAFLWLVLAVTA